MSDRIDVAIVGAGPYGLSIAAHLAQRRLSFRVLGKPMESWLQMPCGMMLKSEGFASSLYDPEGALPLGRYCRERGLRYADLGLPVPLAMFCEYGLAFQRRFVPTLEQHMVKVLKNSGEHFTLELDNGETFNARRVVLAVGISHFAYMPDPLCGLPVALVSHSSAHADVRRFRGTDVTVLGAGASAIDLAVLLHEAGARVRLVTRRKSLPIHARMRLPRPLADRLREPMSEIGPSWRSWFFTNAAPLFHRFPARRRLTWAKSHLGPAGGWFMAERLKPVPVTYGRTPVGATALGDKVQVAFEDQDGNYSRIETEHLIAATGYRPDIGRLAFLEPALREAVQILEGAPILSAHFESSVPGLYFVGPAAVHSFGPVMRFAAGAKFASRRVSSHLAATAGKESLKDMPGNIDGPNRTAARSQVT
ncbi:MAG: NAD(P)/FAD-dependent oxidoreductase [Reyranella sp.]